MATNRFRKALIKGKSVFPRAHLRKKNQNIGIQVYKIQISYLHLGFYSLLQKREDRFQHLKVPIIEHYLELADNQGLTHDWTLVASSSGVRTTTVLSCLHFVHINAILDFLFRPVFLEIFTSKIFIYFLNKKY
ncbi:unnamed protein product, partial [Vitis vinifera]|uniref:Uncharacterized protein n=1 Tax=Vitis vinifera TaxID=29760 RepID=D7UBH3_VITVI